MDLIHNNTLVRSRVIKIGVVMLPPPREYKAIIALSRQLGQKKPKPDFVLDRNHLPHMSLIHSRVRKNRIPLIYKSLKKLTENFFGLRISIGKLRYDTWKNDKYIGLSVKKTKQIYELHKLVADAMLDFEAGPSSFRISSSYKKFEPHFTLGVNANFSGFKVRKVYFKINKVVICLIGNYGTCKKVLTSWQLK